MTIKISGNHTIVTRILTASFATLLLAACSGGNNNNSRDNFQELVDQGVTRYLGVYSPISTSEADGIINYQFAGDSNDGPLCLEGGQFTMATLDQGSEDLMIYLEGGGACWFDFCSATTEAEEGIPQTGILDPDSPINPLAELSMVYVPYCDGGLHASDSQLDSTGDGNIDRFHRGLHNLSASLDVAVQTFPSPRRVILSGLSGGGYGTIFALPLVRQLYPDVPLLVINDSGIGINRPDDPEFNAAVFDYWNLNAFYPESCPECVIQGEPTEYLDWQMKQDDDIQLGMLSYTQDFTIADFFLGIGGPAFEELLRNTVTDLEARNPGRMRSFIKEGTTHTFVKGDLTVSVEDVSVSEWIEQLVDDIPGNWQSVADK